MKKTCFTSCISVLVGLTLTAYSNAQNLDNTVKPELQPFTEKPTGSLRLNERNPEAVRNFARDFGNVSNARWIKSANGFIAYFNHDNIQNWIIYNSKGIREFMIRDYYEEKLPRNVRHTVKSAYYDFSIFCVNEITVKEITIFVITLKNKSNDKTYWKKVQVVDGEMELMTEYSQKTVLAE